MNRSPIIACNQHHKPFMLFMCLPPWETAQRHSVCGSDHPCMTESVRPENLVNAISSMKGISPSFGRRCIWVHRCADWLLGSKGQRSGSQQAEAQLSMAACLVSSRLFLFYKHVNPMTLASFIMQLFLDNNIIRF